MFYEINLQLEAVTTGTLPYGNGAYVHGLFFHLLQEENTVLSENIHDKDELKPYTLSMLQADKLVNWKYKITKGQKSTIRMTFMNDQLFYIFRRSIEKYISSNKTIKVGMCSFVIINYKKVRQEDIDHLVADSTPLYKKLQLQFLSPTSFRRKGINHLYPDPYSIFKSYMDNWNSIDSNPLQISDDELEQMVTACYPVRYNLKTELLDMGRYKIVGFKGFCDYELLTDGNKEIINKMNWLLRFSTYCGTGYKTTMGMGQTRYKIL